jgi:prolipoprotein diacylglyceryltransferase
LCVSILDDGWAPPGDLRFRLPNAIIASYLVLGNCWGLHAFWLIFKNPALLSESTHAFNKLVPGSVFYINAYSSCISVVAVFIGFALAQRKRWGFKRIFALLPFLVLANIARFFVGVFRDDEDITTDELIGMFAIGLIFAGGTNYLIYRFYKRPCREELFFQGRRARI